MYKFGGMLGLSPRGSDLGERELDRVSPSLWVRDRARRGRGGCKHPEGAAWLRRGREGDGMGLGQLWRGTQGGGGCWGRGTGRGSF